MVQEKQSDVNNWHRAIIVCKRLSKNSFHVAATQSYKNCEEIIEKLPLHLNNLSALNIKKCVALVPLNLLSLQKHLLLYHLGIPR